MDYMLDRYWHPADFQVSLTQGFWLQGVSKKRAHLWNSYNSSIYKKKLFKIFGSHSNLILVALMMFYCKVALLIDTDVMILQGKIYYIFFSVLCTVETVNWPQVKTTTKFQRVHWLTSYGKRDFRVRRPPWEPNKSR